MRSSRLFWKLLLACAGLNLAAAIVFAIVVSQWQQRQTIEQADERLRNSALLIRDDVAELMTAGRSDELQQRVHQLGRQIGMRFTVVAMDGTVLADSERESLAQVAEMENHRYRPEIMQAVAGDEGTVARYSATMQAQYRYFALRVDRGGKPVGIVRSALPTDSLRARMATLRRLLGGLVGVVFLGVSAIASWILGRLIRPVAPLTEAADAIAAGDYEHRVYVEQRDELGQLARTLNRMSQDLHVRMTQLNETIARQATVLGGMVEGVIAVDTRQRIVLANQAAGRLFEFQPTRVEGRPLIEIVRNHALHQAVTTAMFTRRPRRLEINREGSDKLIVDVHVTPLPGDPCPGVVLVMHDTTELRRLESLRRDFVANASHELKTPLSSIKAYAETLRNGAIHDPDASHKFLEQIEEQTDRLHRLIMDMLMIARIESTHQAFEIVSVSVPEVVNECLEDRRPAAVARQIDLHVEP
ncbi:MAG: HAMP domain-containing protein, partial [Planctomycetes bacterium]|nr:HAMP domain-containing protein [Planctomycetota bacterium]